MWKAILVLCVGLSIWLWWHRPAAALAFSWSLPTIAALEQGQDTLIVLVLFVAALRLLHSRPALAGALLPLCTIKFHLLVFLPIILVQNRRLAKGFIIGVATLLAVSFSVQNPTWPVAFIALLLSPDLHSGVTAMPSIAGALPNSPYSTKALACLVATFPLGWIIWRIQRVQNLHVSLSAALAAALIVAPHTYVQDAVLTIPLALLLVAVHSRVSLIVLSPLSTYLCAAWIPVFGTIAFLAPLVYLLLLLARTPSTSQTTCGAATPPAMSVHHS